MRRLHREGLIDGDLVVAPDHDLGSQRSECLHEVPREGVVIVEKEDAVSHNPSSASDRAASSAEAFARISSCSRSGTLSVTIPAPAWQAQPPSRRTSVRIAMAWSIPPPVPK